MTVHQDAQSQSALQSPQEKIIFDTCDDKEFERVFLNILGKSHKDNTYKFALARFLLDYAMKHDQTHVDLSVIAESFLEYYWIQVCKLKMKHSPQIKKKPEIIQIIEKEFPDRYYPQKYKTMRKTEPEKIQRCIWQIRKKCFHNVIWRFQKVKIGKTMESRLFFDYKIVREINRNKKFVDLDYGINLNPAAIKFLKRYNAVLRKAVILEWAKFLEILNLGTPKLIRKTYGEIKKGSLGKYRQILDPFFKKCFYCDRQLSGAQQIHVEHVIPFDYIADDDIWNLTLACQKCNLQKSGALPPRKYIDELINRNKAYRTQIPKLEKSLLGLNQDFEKYLENHYQNAVSQGYMVLAEKFYEDAG